MFTVFEHVKEALVAQRRSMRLPSDSVHIEDIKAIKLFANRLGFPERFTKDVVQQPWMYIHKEGNILNGKKYLIYF